MASRKARLEALGFKDYPAYVSSRLWDETRTAYWLDPDTPKVCSVCGTSEPPLLLHHRTYERLGAERLDDLTPLCNRCHQLVHTLERRGDLDGLDADLSILRDPIRAARYKSELADLVREQDEARAELRRRQHNRGVDATLGHKVRAIEHEIAADRKRGRRTVQLENQLERAKRRLGQALV